MSNQGFGSLLISMSKAGPTLTAAAAASMLDGSAKVPLYAGCLNYEGKSLKIVCGGIISCVITTPGTARIDLRLNSIVVADSLAISLNTTAKTNVGWRAELDLTTRIRGNGTTAQLWWQGKFESEALIGSPAATAGGIGVAMLPFNTAPALGAGFDATIQNPFDMFFTQTVATGSFTCQYCKVYDEN